MKAGASSFLLWVVASLAAYGGMVFLHVQHGSLRAGVTPQTIACYLLAFAAYIGALVWVERHEKWPMKWVWATAVLARVLLLFTTPTLSDDVYRYQWDGYVAHHNVSPYTFAINDPALDYLDIPQRALANNTWMASPYLPAAQAVFWLVTFAPLKSVFMQLAMIIFDLLSAAVLAKLLQRAKLPPYRLLLYLWNPLVIVEVAHGAHIDAWMVLLTVTAVYLTLHQQPKVIQNSQFTIHNSLITLKHLLAPLFLALATLTKIIPVLALPVLFWRWSWRQRIFYGIVTGALLLPSGWRAGWGLTGELDGRGVFGALRIYTNQWNFNSGLFHWLEVRLGAPGYGAPFPAAQNIVLAMMMLTLLVIWFVARHHSRERAILRLTAVPFMANIILTPTVHPWYLLILLAFLPFLPPTKGETRWWWLAALPWLYLSGALIFSYLTYLNPQQPAELEWVRQLEWLPTLLLVAVGATAVPFLVRPASFQRREGEHMV